MKLLFSADLHIKLGQKSVPVSWAKNRYSELFEQLAFHQKRADLLVLGGDIFDKIPNMEELEVYFEMLSYCKIPTIIYDGNHEATKKGKTFFTNLRGATEKFNPLVQIVDDFYSFDNIDVIPYCKLKEFEKEPRKFNGNILLTHVRGNIPPHVKAEVDLTLFDRWEVVLAGDLHSHSNSQRNILYPGSPLTTSFHRKEVETGILMYDTVRMEHEFINLWLPQLIRKTIVAGEAMPATEYHHTIYEVEGDMADLGALEDSDLLDKRVVKRSTDTSLMLAPDLTLEEEVSEYLTFILELSDEAIEAALTELNNYASQIKS